jgi:hypothetical protein
MPLSNWNIQWLNLNSQRSYPLTDWGTKRDRTDAIRIPDSFIVAFYLPVHAGLDVEPGKFYLQSLLITPTGYNIGFGYDDGTSSPPLIASANIAKVTHTENRSYAVGGVDDFDDTIGHIAIGTLDEIDALPPGYYVFEPEATPIEVDAIRPIIRGISSITVVDGQDRSPRLYGDIELLAGDNMRIVATEVEGQQPVVTFSAISGEGLNEECVCEEEDEGPCIRFINGIPPLPDGNFRMVGDDCLLIQPIENGLLLVDDCSKPCCGCAELTALTQAVSQMADGVITFKNFVNNLGVEVRNMSTAVLTSRLSDQGCVEC